MFITLFSKLRPNIHVNYSFYEPTQQISALNIFIHAIITLKFAIMLNMIESKPMGARLIKQIEAGKHPIFLKLAINQSTNCLCLNKETCISFGKGSTSIISFNPFLSSELGVPDFIILAHELIHASHAQLGNVLPELKDHIPIWSTLEEHATIVGIPKEMRTEESSVTENDIREEHGLPLRTCH